MIIGLVKEIKNNENRVAITPFGVSELVGLGHTVYVEKSAGVGSGFEDAEYAEAGAILEDKTGVFNNAELIVKVKEPIEEEYKYFKEGQMLFTYLHLAADKKQTEFLVERKITSVAYETVQCADGSLPLLTPMSEVAGRMSIQIGSTLLQKNNGGSGILLSGVPGVAPAEVVIIGGGVVGLNAAKMAGLIGARVTILDINKPRLAYIDDIFNGTITTLMSSPANIADSVKKADLLIGAVLLPGGKCPTIVTENMVKFMKKGSVIVDVAIDQGGSVETIDRVTTHENPTYIKHDVVHYSVGNMPGAVPRTSSFALTGVTMGYLKLLAEGNFEKTIKENNDLLMGVNTYKGCLTCKEVAKAFDMEYTAIEKLI